MKEIRRQTALAIALVLSFATTSASAAIDTGNTGNGELFFNASDSNGSYTFDLNKTIDAFEADLAAPGAINLTYTLTDFGSFLAGVVDPAGLMFNVVASDRMGAPRLLATYTAMPDKRNSSLHIRVANAGVGLLASDVNAVIGSADNVAVDASSTAYASREILGLNFLTFGELGRTYADGLSFMRIDAAASGKELSTYTQYLDRNVAAGVGASEQVRLWVDRSNTLHIAAQDGVAVTTLPVPEPEPYAMLLAGLAMLGFVARRRMHTRL